MSPAIFRFALIFMCALFLSGTSSVLAQSQEEHEGLMLRAIGGFSLESHSDSVDSGFASNLGSKNGNFYGADIFWQLKESDHSIGLKYKHQSTEYSGLTGLTPSTVELSHDWIEFYSYWKPFQDGGWSSQLKLGMGIFFALTNSELTTPNAVFIPKNEFGIALMSKWSGNLAGEFGIEAVLDLNLPFFHQEKKADSGNHIYTFGFDTGVLVTYPVSEMVDIALGLSFGVKKDVYEGSSSNGSSSVSHSQTIFGFPAEVRIKF